MLHDLSFLGEGMPWPPPQESARLAKYEKNRLLFEGRHEAVFREQFRRIERVIGNFNEVISYPVALNFQKIISLKIADLLFGEEPVITLGGEGLNLSAFTETAYEIAIDVSRYGTGLFHLHKEGPETKVSISQPLYWFPVVSADNVKNICLHVVAHVSEEGGKRFLKAAIHEKGFVTTRHYEMDDARIKKLVYDSGRRPTGFRGFAIVAVNNVSTSESVYGLDDYFDLDGIISEIEVRAAQVARILDKHSSPSMTGPSSALSKDEFGNWVFKGGSYIPNDTLDMGVQGEIKYITWDAQLESNFKQIALLLDMLYMLSECGATLLGGSRAEGPAQSGTALKLRMMSPLAKVNRVKLKFTHAIKSIVAEMTGGDYEDVGIEWKDGLPTGAENPEPGTSNPGSSLPAPGSS